MNIQHDRHEFKMVYDIYYTNGTHDLSKWFEISQPRPVRSPLISSDCRPSPGQRRSHGGILGILGSPREPHGPQAYGPRAMDEVNGRREACFREW